MADIAPELLESIRKDFEKFFNNAKIEKLDYLGAEEYAEKVGDALAKAFKLNIAADKLPEGRMFWNIAERVIRPMLELDYKLISSAAAKAQQTINKAAGLGLKAQTAPINEDKVSGILNKVAEAESFEKVAWMLDEPIRTFSRSIVDDVLKKNVDFQGRAGLRPRVIRKAESKCCKWCSNLAGVYEYPDVPEDVYRRHENCRCTVEYDPGDGKKLQNVHTKKWISKEESAILEKRKKIGLNIKNSSRFLPDITIGRSVGAKATNYDIMDLETGEFFNFAEGTRIHNIEVFAGKGSRTPYRKAYKYANLHGGKPKDWQHVKGHGIIATNDGDRPAEVHWSQCNGIGKFDFFVKKWED